MTRRPATIIVRVDHSALVRGARQAGETCEIDGVGTVSVATARALLPDSILALVIADGIDIRSVVHLGRRVTAHQHTALLARDRECVVPGCHARRGLEIDHVEDWALTKVTRLDSLARLCAAHHHQKTYAGWTLHGPPGQWTWHPPPTRDHPGTDPPTPPPDPPPRPHPGPPRARPGPAHPSPARPHPGPAPAGKPDVPTDTRLFD